jgi:chromosome segregation ATPase
LIVGKKELLDQLHFEAEDLFSKKEQIEYEHSNLRHDLNRFEAEKQELLTTLQTGNNLLEESLSRERELTLDLENIESRIDNKSHNIEALRAEINEIDSENDQLKSLIREKEFQAEELQSAVTCLESNLVADETEKRRMMD